MNDIQMPIAITYEQIADVHQALEITAASLAFPSFDVQGFGVFRRVELDASGGVMPARLFAGPIVAASFSGRCRRKDNKLVSEFVGVFCKETENGIVTVGGVVVAGAAISLELRIIPVALDESSASAIAHTQDAPAWERLAKESSRLAGKNAALDLEEPEELMPALGDTIRHRQFGLCTVVKLTDDHIAIKKTDGRIVSLGITVLKFASAGVDGKHTIWEVTVKK